MFTPINKETSKKKIKSIVRERRKIKALYYAFLIELDNLNNIFDIQLEFEENRTVLNQIKEYALYNFLLVKENISNTDYDILSFRKPTFLLIRKAIDNKEFVRAKKLLNICKAKGFMSNEYYDLLKRIPKC